MPYLSETFFSSSRSNRSSRLLVNAISDSGQPRKSPFWRGASWHALSAVCLARGSTGLNLGSQEFTPRRRLSAARTKGALCLSMLICSVRAKATPSYHSQRLPAIIKQNVSHFSELPQNVSHFSELPQNVSHFSELPQPIFSPWFGAESHDDVFYLCGEQAAAEAPIEIAKTGNAEQAENVARTAPACNIHDALSACESRACWGDLKQHSPPSFLQEPLPRIKLPPPPPPSFKPLQQIDAEDAPPRAWLALLLHADEK